MSEGCEAGCMGGAGRTPPLPRDHEPMNLKSEQESERDSPGSNSPGAPRPAPSSPAPPDEPRPLAPANSAINGTMASMFQNLQNLANLQSMQSMPQMSQLAANLQALTSLPGSPVINSPLNLSVGAGMTAQKSVGQAGVGGSCVGASTGGLPPAAMPQLVLASGQLIQGIQGAQLLIPTSQGIATQTILTIPVNHVNSNDQMVNLALNNGQVVSTSLANLQAMTQPHQLLGSTQNSSSMRPNPGMLNPLANALLNQAQSMQGFLSNGAAANAAAANAQDLLQALQQHQQQQAQMHQHSNTNGGCHSLLQPLPQNINPLQSRQSISPGSGRPDSVSSQNHSQSRHYKERDSISSGYLTGSGGSSHGAASYLSEISRERDRHMSRERERERDRERETDCGSGGPANGVGNPPHSMAASAAALSSINRLAATNGEITITTSHNAGGGGLMSPQGGGCAGLMSPHGGGVGGGLMSPHTHKVSSGSMKMSPTGTDHSGDFLADSPNQQTISQTSSNVVDGINLDDIKEFAKAFKLRRLGLGLTQTQVGQALSVTEGPAYSQSAICSALASQMLAAQMSSQQQNIFEKLDITPKSAQKIKPVLERWMKEAEERYASGQNHLTDFIGMEPSKKRKRRTSFTPQALELLNAHFERNTHPSGTEITGLAHQLGYEREVIRIWFCNKRQALKNTVRMMSKGMV